MRSLDLAARQSLPMTPKLIATCALLAAASGFIPSAAIAQTCPPSGWQNLLPTLGLPARASTAMATDSVRGNVVLFGGGGPGITLGDTWTYSSGVWTERQVAGPAARIGHALAFDSARGRVVLFGGVTDSGVVAETWEWDGAQWMLAAPAQSPPPRTGFSLAYDGVSQRIILVGGTDADTGVSDPDCWAYDGATWTLLPILGPSPRVNAAATFDAGRQRVVIFGGLDPATFDQLADTWEFDGSTWSDVTPTISPSAREAAGLAYDSARQRTVLFGGSGDTRDTWEFDGAGWTLASADGPNSRIDLPLAQDPTTGRVIRPEPEPARTRTWNGIEWSVVGPAFPPALNGHSMVFDTEAQRPLLFGGTTFLGQQVPGLWSLDGSTWQLLREDGPSPRDRVALAYDTLRTRLIAFGGSTEDARFGDTWILDNGVWTELAGSGPSPRAGAAVAYDPIRDRLYLFGGLDENFDRLGDTWTFDGSSWTQLSPPTSPVGRDRAAMVFDSVRGKVVLFGGRDANFEVRRDLWEFDGVNWTLIADDTLVGRYAAGLSFDAAQQKLVAFGGIDSDFTVSRENWVRSDPNGWQQPAAPTPGPRSDLAMVYDPSRQRTVMYGGFDESRTVGDTWLFAAGLTAAITQQPAPTQIITCPGTGDIVLTIAANGSPLAYAWFRDGAPIDTASNPSAATATLVLAGPAETDSGVYVARVTDNCGAVLSSAVRVNVNPADSPDCTACPCIADVDDGSGSGTCDGGVGIEDLLYYLGIYDAGIADADVDDGSSTGTPDGGVGIEDLLYYLQRYDAGC